MGINRTYYCITCGCPLAGAVEAAQHELNGCIVDTYNNADTVDDLCIENKRLDNSHIIW